MAPGRAVGPAPARLGLRKIGRLPVLEDVAVAPARVRIQAVTLAGLVVAAASAARRRSRGPQVSRVASAAHRPMAP
ncbi:hypothetical protein AHIS1636_24210 [Arthrobacter mangrovi]|uniref:Uncharacterized protein n=1 Tax=Arthrobacter mangrovi TaxID=2966350 RepID=A0ABQ5MVK5_9MICC|nr:hypothetical protein AHIS1636_24210 [Arthrobacter mangrovi]